MSKPEPPEQPIKHLEREPQEAKDTAYLVDEMMTLMDQQYVTHLRKKYVSKQRSRTKPQDD